MKEHNKLYSETNSFFSKLSGIPIVIALFALFATKITGDLFITRYMPSFLLMTVIFWVNLTEERFSLRSVFILGILEDLISGTPLGLWVLGFLLCKLVVSFQTGFWYPNSFWGRWIVFSLVSTLVYIMMVVGINLLSQGNIVWKSIMPAYVANIFIFPFYYFILIRIESYLVNLDMSK